MITCGPQIVSGAPVFGGGGGVPTTRTITAGTGLTGGGDLSADRTLAVSFGTTAGTVAAGDDSRIVNAVPNTRQVIAGTGLTGGGDLTANRTLAVSYGTTAGTAAQGNDSRLSDARTPTAHAASHGSAGSDPITIASTQVTGLGGAALLSVGTTAGTVAAGNDSRIVGAVQTSRIFAGLDLSADRSVDAVNASLGSRIAAPDTGWTDVTSLGTVSRASGVTTLGVNSNGLVRTHRAGAFTPECPAIEVIGRFVVTSASPPPTVWHTALSIANAADNYGFLALVFDNAGVGLYQANNSSYALVASTGANAVVFTGSSWIRLLVTPSYASASYGTSATSTPPTSWTVASSVATTIATLAGGFIDRTGIRMGRTATGSGTYTCEWRNFQTRILGVAP